MKKIMILANDTTYVYNLRGALIERLIKEKNEVIIAAQILNFEDELVKMGCSIINVSIGRQGKNPLSDLKLLKQYKKIMKKEKPDIVFSYNIKPNIYGGIACSKFNIRFMPNITGLGTALEYPGIMQKITILLNRFGLKKADTVFFQNSENQDFFKTKKILSKKTKTVLLPGSGVDLNKHKLFEYPNDEKIRFLYVSRIMKDKGIDIFLETAKVIKQKYPNTEFNICGYCDDKKYIKVLKEYQDKGIIAYHGEQKDLITFYKNANCLIHPSYYPEGMSNVLLETASHGRPIICTNRSGCRETVDDGKTGFVVPIKNTEKVIEATERIIKMSNDSRKQMGLNGRRKMEKEFDRNIVINEYINLVS